ncbi:50S ribosomal protein L2 [archaeon]|nr:50S ribosomal protein L2 [archaeon]
MGKRTITQRRGKGSPTYKSPSFRFAGKISYPNQSEDGLAKNAKAMQGIITDIIHSPGHTAPIASIKYQTREECIMPAPLNAKVGDTIVANPLSATEHINQPGNILPIKDIPVGTPIFNIEPYPGAGGKFARGAGTSARITAKFEDKVTIMLPSKKLKDFSPNCRATIGIIAGGGKKEKPFVKAGKRYLVMKAKNKLYPRTAGVAMNAVDHPFGSGRGRHMGKPKTPPRFAPPGRNVGLLHARKTQGKTLEQIKIMDIKEFAKLVPSRQRRSLLRPQTPMQKRLFAKIKKFREGRTKKPIKTHCRNAVITPEMLDITIHVHNGKEFIPTLIQPEMLGHFLGEFTLTRKKVEHSAPGIGATKSSAAMSVK